MLQILNDDLFAVDLRVSRFKGKVVRGVRPRTQDEETCLVFKAWGQGSCARLRLASVCIFVQARVGNQVWRVRASSSWLRDLDFWAKRSGTRFPFLMIVLKLRQGTWKSGFNLG